MQIVILAAGRGKRMNNLTDEKPKPLLQYKGKSLLEHKLEIVPDGTTEIIIVIGYLGDLIKKEIGDFYKNIPIRYVEQKEMRGTADALWSCKPFLKDKFIVLMGDDIYNSKDLENLSKESWAILAYPDPNKNTETKIVVNDNNFWIDLEKDPNGESRSNLIYTGACILTPEIFEKEMVKISESEYGLPQTILQFVNEKNIKVLQTNNWKRVTSPEDLN